MCCSWMLSLPPNRMVYLAYAAVLISPRLDGTTTPLKIYSYLHANKPIVATNITAHTQLLSPETAVLVEPNKDPLPKEFFECCGTLNLQNVSQKMHMNSLRRSLVTRITSQKSTRFINRFLRFRKSKKPCFRGKNKMCGICGVVSFQPNTPADRSILLQHECLSSASWTG